jgi:hypothetical protein
VVPTGENRRLTPLPDDEGDSTIAYEPFHPMAPRRPADEDLDATLVYPAAAVAAPSAKIATPEKTSPWLVPVKRRRLETSTLVSDPQFCPTRQRNDVKKPQRSVFSSPVGLGLPGFHRLGSMSCRQTKQLTLAEAWSRTPSQ